jgi:flagellar FliL protein
VSDAPSRSAADAPDRKKGRTGLIVALAAVVLLGGGGGGAAWWFLGRGDPDPEAEAARAQARREATRQFVTLEPFVVNLADRESERYAQVGIVLEVEGAESNKRIADRMPAVRNEILLLISSKQAQQLTTREGKEQLAAEIALAAARPLGWKPPDARLAEQDREPAASPKLKASDRNAGDRKGRKDTKDRTADAVAEPVPNPVARVHFASFIVQ